MIDIRELTKDWCGTAILDGITAHIGRNEKIGLIGRNGAGKTTLLRILTGDDADYSGTVARAGDVRIGFVPQRIPDFAGTALDFIVEPFAAMRAELAELENEMERAQGKALEKALARYGTLRAEYDALGGDIAEESAQRFLASLGLETSTDVDVGKLSGGERNALALARAALTRPELLVLDEPGNHLDIWGLAWLEDFIQEYRGTVLVVSHNRYLLDRTVSRVIEISRGQATEFSGNYSVWRMEKLRRAVSGEMAWRAGRKKLDRLEEVVRRFEEIARTHPDPKWGKRLRARKTQLEKAETNAAERPAGRETGPDIRFDNVGSKADIALKIVALTCAYGERVLLDDVSLLVRTGERVAIVGANGTGKTTLLEAIRTAGAPDGTAIRTGPSMRIAFCSQHGETVLRHRTVLDACLAAGSKNADDAGKALAQFLFPRESLAQEVTSLSGGEINRLQLALAVIGKANFLILDEPTNHLDIESCEAVEDALAEFTGTILVVSHDRYFLDRVATRIVEIDDRHLVSYEGNFSEFWFTRYGADYRRPFGIGSGDTGSRGKEINAAKKTASDAGKSTTREQEGNAAIERRIIALETERDRLEKQLENERAEGRLDKARATGNRLASTAKQIEELYEAWG
jgi:ATP-binding cassette subfamily F protein 3